MKIETIVDGVEYRVVLETTPDREAWDKWLDEHPNFTTILSMKDRTTTTTQRV